MTNKYTKLHILLLLIIVVVLAIWLLVTLLMGTGQSPNEVSYSEETAANGVVLNVLQADPEKVMLHAIDDNVTRSGMNGINGGFFWEKQLLSIAVNDGNPVNGQPKEYGSGWFNIKYKRGTLVYDRSTKLLTVQRAGSTEELEVTSRTSFWAQGGVSMSLSMGDDSRWRTIAVDEEALPFPDDNRLRSGMAFDSQLNVYLIVSSTKCTAEQFREAILEKVGAGKLVDGIFLDGDGSSQLLAEDIKLEGDNRTVLQMVGVGQ